MQTDVSSCLQQLKMNTMPATNIPGVLPAELVLLALNLALHDNKQKAFSVHTFAEQQQLVELDRLLQFSCLDRAVREDREGRAQTQQHEAARERKKGPQSPRPPMGRCGRPQRHRQRG
mmetsp:Transcript_31515/g.62299  ORF Transcript_31515/g.62299 Transcript_31515/m.62299 type:complete len:118 (-) Transcript_31515:410-763(-)